MNNYQIAILVFSIILLVATIVNLVFDIFYEGWAMYISWFDNALCLATGIMFICALRLHLRKNFYKISLIFLYISDIIAIAVFILCFFFHNFINYSKIATIVTLTPFVVIVQLFVNKFSILNLPVVATPRPSFLPGMYQYQEENDPNIESANYQPGNVPNTQSNYQPPQYQDGNGGNRPGFEPIAPQSNRPTIS